MGLENAQWISELVDTNPVTATDPVSEGANHLRMIKEVLQNTFPGYDGVNGAVELTPDQLNDAALKSAANTFTDTNTFNLLIQQANNNAHVWEDNAGGTYYDGLRLSANDVFVFGVGTINAIAHGLSQFEHQINNVAVARFVDAASGSLLAADSLGALSEVAKLGAVQEVTAAWGFSASPSLANAVPLLGNNLADTESVELVEISSNDLVLLGSNLYESRVQSLSTLLIRVADSNEAWFTTRDLGTLIVKDMVGTNKKAGFRNPSRVQEITNTPALQEWEGQVTNVGAAAQTITIDPLETGTVITFLVTGNAPVTFAKGAVTSFRLFNGDSVLGLGTGFTANVGSIIQIYWQSGQTVNVWGNGITPL